MEIILTILWVAYGIFSTYQADVQEEVGFMILFILLSPLVLFLRIFYGIFSKDVF